MRWGKKAVCVIFTVCCSVAFLGACTAEESNLCSVRDGSSGCDSFAWTPEYLFIAHGEWGEDEYAWTASQYRITRIERSTGREEVLIEAFPATCLDLFVEDDQIYLFWQSYWTEAWESDVRDNICYTQILDFEGNQVEETKQIALGDYAVEHVFGDHRLYLLTWGGIIYEWDFQNGDARAIYTANFIENDEYHARAILRDNTLFFQDEDRIVAMNLDNYETRTLAAIDFTHENAYYEEPAVSSRLQQRYHYMVLNNALYYYDFTQKEMMKLDLSSGMSQSISENEYYFIQAGKEGVVATRCYALDKYNLPEVKYFYFPYENIAAPDFDPENVAGEELLYGFEALMDNAQWLVEKESGYLLGEFVYEWRDPEDIEETSYVIWSHQNH